MKNPNGYGCIKRLPGNRRKPWAAIITTGYNAGAKDISFIRAAVGEGLYEEVEEMYREHMIGSQHARQEKKYLGYYATRQEAMIALAEYNKNPVDLDKRNTTFGEIYEILYKDKFSKMKNTTKSTYTSSIQKCDSIKNICMRDLRDDHMQKIMNENSHLSKSSQHNMLVLFHTIYKYALQKDIIQKDYSQFVTITSEKEVKDKTPFSREEVSVLWDNLDNYEMTDAILIMIYTGVRISELRYIEKENVHLEKRYIEVWGTKTDAAERYVPIHKKIVPLLKNRLTETGNYLFTSTRGKAMSYSNMRDKFDAIMDGLEMSHTPHDTRHSFVTYATASDLNRPLLKKMVGHATSDVTDRVYTHTFIEDLRREIDKFEI